MVLETVSQPPPSTTSVEQANQTSFQSGKVDAAELAKLKNELAMAEERARSADRIADETRDASRMSQLLLLFGFPAVFIAGFYFARYKNYEHLNATLRSLIEREVAVPPELLTPAVRKNLGWSDFRKGILWIWVGIASTILLNIIFHGPAGSVGLVPIFIGGAYLLLWFMDRRKQQQPKM
jgi:hypothetical protein